MRLYTALFFLFALGLIFPSAGKEVTRLDFGNIAQRRLYTLDAQYPRGARFAKVVRSGDKASLVIDSRGTSSEWNSCFRTLPGLFQPGCEYQVTFRCRGIAVDKTSYALFVIRSLDARDDGSDLRQTIFSKPGEREITLTFRIPPDRAKYSFQVHTHMGAAVQIDDFTIAETAPVNCSEFLPISGETKPDAPLVIPTGAAEFSIDLPRPATQSSVSVAEFGASPEKADNTGAFNAAIARCKEKGIAKLTVPKGTYRFTSDAELAFAGLTDFEFDGGDSLFVFHREKVKGRLISIESCTRTLFHNFKIDWDWERDPLASVVSLEKVGPKGEYIDLRFVDYQEFPRKTIGVPPYMEQLDPATLSPGCENAAGVWWGDGNGVKMEWLSGNLLRVYARGGDRRNFSERLKPGSLFRINHYAWALIGVLMSGDSHLTLENVTLYSAPGAGFVSWGGIHHWQLRNVAIARPPGINRPITCTADHHHVAGSRGYLKMENCDFGFGGDDGLNVHDNSGFGIRTSARSAATKYPFTPGEPVEFRHTDFSPAGFSGTVREVRDSAKGKPWKEIFFDADLPGRDGDEFVLFNRNCDSGHVIVRNCKFHDNRARGVLILAHDVLVENNTFTHNQMSAIKIETGYTLNSWCEGYGAYNIVIRNNRFENINPMGGYPNEMSPVIYMSVYLKTDPSLEKTAYPVLHDILIENNRFSEFPGTVAFISSARNVIFRDNEIANTVPRRKGLPYRGALGAAYASEVFVTGNRWLQPLNGEKPGLWLDPKTTKNVYLWDNRIASESGQ